MRDQETHRGRRNLRSSRSSPVATYQSRICNYRGVDHALGDGALSAYAELHGLVERKLFAEVAAGRSATSLKSGYLKRYGIPARMFNGVLDCLGDWRHPNRIADLDWAGTG